VYHHNVIALDLAKRVIQISKVTPPGEILYNKAVLTNKAKEIIANTKPCNVAMEGCGSFHYWGVLRKNMAILFEACHLKK
jgi:transposase